MNTWSILGYAVYFISLVLCARYYFGIVTKYNGISLGRCIRALILTLCPILNTITGVIIVSTIFYDISYHIGIYKRIDLKKDIFNRAGERINADQWGVKYAPQEDYYILQTFRLLWAFKAAWNAVFNYKIVGKTGEA